MPDERLAPNSTEAKRQARELAALIDAVADDLERNGPVSPDELLRRLEALEREWGRVENDTAASARAGRRQR
jgi:hypothetical protein